MDAHRYMDKEKSCPSGTGVEVDGVVIRRQRGMIYWYRWGRHTFDIRVMRKLLGLPKESRADQYFMPGNEYAGDGDRALADHVAAINAARGDRPFKQLMEEHDSILHST